MKCDQLKAFDITVAEEYRFEGIVKYRRAVYDKSEADKVIADLEESHKMEVEQLLMEIVELKKKLDIYKGGFKEVDKIIADLYAKLRHANYKRCLDKAEMCENKLGTVVKPGWWDKWRRRWLELAEKFREASK